MGCFKKELVMAKSRNAQLYDKLEGRRYKGDIGTHWGNIRVILGLYCSFMRVFLRGGSLPKHPTWRQQGRQEG